MKESFIDEAKAVLKLNDQGSYTMPAKDLYPHQWLWDSCFIAIGMRNYDVGRAKNEILSLFRGQWHNGMMPDIIFGSSKYSRDSDIWRSWLNPFSPDDITTSGITQPPMIAEAVVKVGEKMSLGERRAWYRLVMPRLIDYHEWLYEDRDPHGEGLVLLVHPWECGLDNTPPWMSELHKHLMPLWVRMIEKLHLTLLVNIFRRDTKFVSAKERPTTSEALAMYSAQRRLRRKHYNVSKILPHSLFAIEDLSFNCILIRANHHLREIAKTLSYKLPSDLLESMRKTEKALEGLWDPFSNQYYSRNFVNHELLKESSIATLLPLYAGNISEERAKQLVKLIENQHLFGSDFPIPSTPLNSAWFDSKRYWQGPSWVNTNWLIIEGLKNYGFKDYAEAIAQVTLEMVGNNGFYEYFDPLSGEPAGTKDFSWSAALSIDLAKNYK